MTPCASSSSIPTVDVEVTINDSCNCCFPFVKKNKAKKVKKKEQNPEVEKTDEKVNEIINKISMIDEENTED